MPYHIKKSGSKFVVEKADGSKQFGTHDTEADAKKQLAALNIAEKRSNALIDASPAHAAWMNAEERSLHLLSALGQVRSVVEGALEYLVVPVVALMEGVIHAVNAETPEFVPLTTLRKAAESWNGRPVTLGHPKRDGKQCSAQDPGIIASHGIGNIRNSRVDGKKLLCEAWVEKAKAKRLHPDMYQRLLDGGTEEVSVGALVVTDKIPGTLNGKPFMASWVSAEGDHLAFLPGGRGACSVEMGCGTHRAAMRVCLSLPSGEDVMQLEVLGSLPDKSEVAVQIGKKVTINKPGHAAHGKTGTVTASKDGKHTVGSYGSFSPAELKTAQAGDDVEEQAELIAYQSMRTVLDGVSGQYEKISELVDALIADETESPTETAEEEDSEEQIETARLDAIRTICQSLSAALSAVSSMTYCQSLSDGPRYMAALAGARHNVADTKAIQAVHDHSMALGATCDRGNYKTLDGKIKEDEPKLKDGKLGDANPKLNDPNVHYIELVKHRAK